MGRTAVGYGILVLGALLTGVFWSSLKERIFFGPEFTLQGYVREENGAPIPGAEVQYHTMDFLGRSPGPTHHVLTNAQGWFFVNAGGRLFFKASKDGFLPLPESSAKAPSESQDPVLLTLKRKARNY